MSLEIYFKIYKKAITFMYTCKFLGESLKNCTTCNIFGNTLQCCVKVVFALVNALT